MPSPIQAAIDELVAKKSALQVQNDAIDDAINALRAIDNPTVRYRSRRQARTDKILEQRRAGKTLQELADALGITRERIRQIEAVAVNAMSEEDQATYLKIIKPSLFRDEPERTRHNKSRLKEHLSVLSSIDYWAVCAALGLKPLMTEDEAFMLPEVAACRIFLERFGVHQFGKYIHCWRCDGIKPASYFPPSVKARGSNRLCRPCNAERACLRYHYDPNYREYIRKYRREHPEVQAAATRRYIAKDPIAHKEMLRRSQAKRMAADPEGVREKWREANRRYRERKQMAKLISAETSQQQAVN